MTRSRRPRRRWRSRYRCCGPPRCAGGTTLFGSPLVVRASGRRRPRPSPCEPVRAVRPIALVARPDVVAVAHRRTPRAGRRVVERARAARARTPRRRRCRGRARSRPVRGTPRRHARHADVGATEPDDPAAPTVLGRSVGPARGGRRPARRAGPRVPWAGPGSSTPGMRRAARGDAGGEPPRRTPDSARLTPARPRRPPRDTSPRGSAARARRGDRRRARTSRPLRGRRRRRCRRGPRSTSASVARGGERRGGAVADRARQRGGPERRGTSTHCGPHTAIGARASVSARSPAASEARCATSSIASRPPARGTGAPSPGSMTIHPRPPSRRPAGRGTEGEFVAARDLDRAGDAHLVAPRQARDGARVRVAVRTNVVSTRSALRRRYASATVGAPPRPRLAEPGAGARPRRARSPPKPSTSVPRRNVSRTSAPASAWRGSPTG